MNFKDPMYAQQSVIMPPMENQSAKRPRLTETTTIRNLRAPYKTLLCSSFRRGQCSYGGRCHYAHGYEELRQPLQTRRQGRGVVNEGCFGGRFGVSDENQNPRPEVERRLCWRFENGEVCPFGNGCHFIHSREGERSVVIDILNGGSGSGKGCDNDDDRMPHRKQLTWKTRLCIKWMLTGSCPYGLKCCYAHGESELQKQGSKNALTKDDASSKGCTTDEKQVAARQWAFKWKDVKKINCIYADWIDDLPSVLDGTGQAGS